MTNQKTPPSARDLLDAIYDPEEDGVNDSVRYGFVVECFDRLVAAGQDQKTPVQGGATEVHEFADTGSFSDGHHTFDELYEYRMLYNAHAANGWLAAGLEVVKSWRHSDGEFCFGGGWFIVTAMLPTGQVSNHYRAANWDLFDVPVVELPPEHDGHSPADAADRLRQALSVSASADPADEHHDAEERQAESEDHAATVAEEDEELDDCPACDAHLSDCSPNAACCEDCTHGPNFGTPSRDHAATVTGALRREPVQRALDNLSALDLNSPITREGTAWGSLLREAKEHLAAALAAPVEVDEAKLAEVLYAAWNEEPGNAIPFLSSEARIALARVISEWLRGVGR